MQVRQYVTSDLGDIQAWALGWNTEPPKPGSFPKYGLVAQDESGVLLAAGWVRQCEGGVALFDSLLTNPDASPKQRHDALELLVPDIIRMAYGLGMTKLVAFTQAPDVLARSLHHGFVTHPHTVISRPLP